MPPPEPAPSHSSHSCALDLAQRKSPSWLAHRKLEAPAQRAAAWPGWAAGWYHPVLHKPCASRSQPARDRPAPPARPLHGPPGRLKCADSQQADGTTIHCQPAALLRHELQPQPTLAQQARHAPCRAHPAARPAAPPPPSSRPHPQRCSAAQRERGKRVQGECSATAGRGPAARPAARNTAAHSHRAAQAAGCWHVPAQAITPGAYLWAGVDSCSSLASRACCADATAAAATTGQRWQRRSKGRGAGLLGGHSTSKAWQAFLCLALLGPLRNFPAHEASACEGRCRGSAGAGATSCSSPQLSHCPPSCLQVRGDGCCCCGASKAHVWGGRACKRDCIMCSARLQVGVHGKRTAWPREAVAQAQGHAQHVIRAASVSAPQFMFATFARPLTRCSRSGKPRSSGAASSKCR